MYSLHVTETAEPRRRGDMTFDLVRSVQAPDPRVPEAEGGRLLRAPFRSVRSRPKPSRYRVQLVMVRLVDSQWLEPDTLGSVLVKVTFHETLVLAVTVKVVLVVVSDCGDVAFVSVFV